VGHRDGVRVRRFFEHVRGEFFAVMSTPRWDDRHNSAARRTINPTVKSMISLPWSFVVIIPDGHAGTLGGQP
jgi:hypothetical protein